MTTAALRAFQIALSRRGHHPGAGVVACGGAACWRWASAATLREDQVVIVNLSGRGDKDINTVAAALDVSL